MVTLEKLKNESPNGSLLSAPQAAAKLGITYGRLLRWIASGEIPGVVRTRGGQVRLSPEVVDRLLAGEHV